MLWILGFSKGKSRFRPNFLACDNGCHSFEIGRLDSWGGTDFFNLLRWVERKLPKNSGSSAGGVR